MKNEIRNIIQLWDTHYHKKGYKNIDYRKLITSLYNSFLKPVNRKTAAKKWVLIKPHCENNEWKLNCDYKQEK